MGDCPCLTTLERVPGRSEASASMESQWSASRGDQLFREKLVKYGFKGGAAESPGGWRCYITCLVKEADYTNSNERTRQSLYLQYTQNWLPVLQWELYQSRPSLLVAMGGRVESALNFLARKKGLQLPRRASLSDAAYIGSRGCGDLGPMHPLRVQEYDEEMEQISRLFQS